MSIYGREGALNPSIPAVDVGSSAVFAGCGFVGCSARISSSPSCDNGVLSLFIITSSSIFFSVPSSCPSAYAGVIVVVAATAPKESNDAAAIRATTTTIPWCLLLLLLLFLSIFYSQTIYHHRIYLECCTRILKNTK